MFTPRTLASCGLVAAGLLAAGCADSHGGRQEVTGTVKLKGQPLKDGGLVVFEPLDNQDTGATATTAGGAFTIPRQSGLKPGKYLVRVTAGDGTTPVNPVDPDTPPGPGGTNIISKDLVPKDWNVDSKQQVTVAAGGPNKFDFDIP